MTESPCLFISHASTDTEYTEYLVDRLRASGYRPWVDAENIPPGAAWVRAIEDGIARCSALIVVLSAAARASEWVEREVLLAYELRKPVFIALFEDIALPIWAINRQYSDFRKRRETGLNRLLAALAAADLTAPMTLTPAQAKKLSPLPNETNYFKYLEKTYSSATAQVARSLYDWMRAHCDNISFSGRREPAVHGHVYVGPGGVLIASLRAFRVNPALELPLAYLADFPPYDQPEMRLQIIHTLNTLFPPGQGLADDRADRRPTIPLLPTLATPERQAVVTGILAEIVEHLHLISGG
ncbi:MAG: toll/interleukin-1 receptor domain-containing protein [Candidatus Flexifilum sp.]|jgi:hypothetical protein